MPSSVLFLSTYPPRECGVAAFTESLVQELKKSPRIQPQVLAVAPKPLAYSNDVQSSFSRDSRLAHISAAESINACGAGLLVVQHGQGVFGGPFGTYLLDLLERVCIPSIVICHHVPAHPEAEWREMLSSVCYLCAAVVVLSRASRHFLAEAYGVPPEKIIVMDYGLPAAEDDRDTLKAACGISDKTIISSFGLLSPDKGIEYGIEAMAEVSHRHPEVYYLILGPAHQRMSESQQRSYRSGMEKLASALGVQHCVRFVNHYISQAELLRTIRMSDICMFPYLGHELSSSGALAAAVGCGRAVVATPFPYALEALAEGRGLFAHMSDADSLAQCLTHIIETPELKLQMERLAAQRGKTMQWSRQAQQYEALFARTAAQAAGLVS